MAGHVSDIHNHPSVQDHYKLWENLISQEKSQRSDHEFRLSLSPTAKRAHEIVSQIRTQEHRTLWTSTAENGDLFPGMMFNTAKTHMRHTKLWKIVSKMPKGALLHCHLGAMVDLEWVFGLAVEETGMGFAASNSLSTVEAREKAAFRFEFSSGVKGSGKSVWDGSYQPNALVDLKAAAEGFPEGGKKGFVQWAARRCVISPADSESHHLGVDDIWKKLVFGFTVISPVVFYEPILRPFLRRFWKTMLEDGVRWVEMRGMTRSLRLQGEDGICRDKTDMVRIVREELDGFMASEEGKGFWGCRIIWDSLRSFDDEFIFNDMHDCIRAKKMYPDTISGYDFVGPEDEGRTLHELTPLIMYFRQQCIEQNLTIPFFFHAGECLGSGDSTDHNLYDALLFNTRRIGHGFSLFKHPLLIDMVREKQILVESCPISNEVLRYSASILSHPLPALLNRGVKACLSNDDPALMGHGSGGVGCDFWQALQGWEDLGLAGLGSLAENSVRWSAFEDQSDEEWLEDVKAGAQGNGLRAQRIREWKVEWEEFCEWIVREFREDVLN